MQGQRLMSQVVKAGLLVVIDLSLIVIRQRLFIGIGSLHWTPSNYVARD